MLFIILFLFLVEFPNLGEEIFLSFINFLFGQRHLLRAYSVVQGPFSYLIYIFLS